MLKKHFMSTGWAWNPDEETVRALERGKEKLKAYKSRKENQIRQDQFRILCRDPGTRTLHMIKQDDDLVKVFTPIGHGYYDPNTRIFTTEDQDYVVMLDDTLTPRPIKKKVTSTVSRKPQRVKSPDPDEMISLKLLLPPGVTGTVARRKLRAAGYSSGDQGRWEFPVSQSQRIIAILKGKIK